MKNAIMTSQMTGWLNPLSASERGSVRDSVTAPSAHNATAPIGIGSSTMPTMVDTNIARSCQASGVTPSGRGRNQMTRPIATDTQILTAADPGVREDSHLPVRDVRFGGTQHSIPNRAYVGDDGCYGAGGRAASGRFEDQI
jgi:hypothetical protein